MSVTFEKTDNNEAKLTIEVTAARFEEGLEEAYKKNRGRFQIPGFRKGKAPKNFVEKMYGPEIFYEDAVNYLINEEYPAAYEEVKAELDIASRPEIDVVQVEKGKPMIFTAQVALKPVVTLGEYKGIEVEKISGEVTDEEIEDELKKVKEANSRTVEVSDRAAKEGDITTIDFEGFIDGVPFDGGKGTDYKLTLGTHSFIDTFEDQVAGHNTGDEFDVNVTFPEEYGAAELAGKPAVFKVALKKIEEKEYPELDDEFAEEVSDFSTMAEYKESIRKDLAEKKNKEGLSERENTVVEKTVANSTVSFSALQVNEMAGNMLRDMERNMRQQGITMEMYLQYTGMTKEQLLEQQKPNAEERIKSRAVLLAVAEAENIEVSEADIEAKYEEFAKLYNMELENVKKVLGEDARTDITNDLKVEKAVDLLVAAAVEV